MKHTWKKFLSAFLAVVLVLSLAPVSVFAATSTATNVSYIDATGSEQTASSATVVESDTTTWTNGWYVVQGNVSISDRITVTGDVHLILADNCHLDADSGIEVSGTNSLTIYAQSTGSNMGAITSEGNTIYNDDNAKGVGSAGIGGTAGGDQKSGGSITINGGKITARGGMGYGGKEGLRNSGAGIGGANGGTSGTIVINGGIVDSRGRNYGGAGIGGGECAIVDTITINGGVVTAVGGYGGAGIGSGWQNGDEQIDIKESSIITINGGIVTATGGTGGAGIGNGRSNTGCVVNITGGSVTANGGDVGSGIGTGFKSAGCNVTISGGDVTANGGWKTEKNDYGVGIGTGDSTYQANGSFQATGTAVIKANTQSTQKQPISDETNKASWSGVIFNGADGKVYGNQTLTSDLTVPSGSTLTIPAGVTLTVPEGITIINNGTIKIENDGKLEGSGTIDASNGTVEGSHTLRTVYSVTAELNGLTFSGEPYAVAGANYTASIAPLAGSSLPGSITVSVGGADLSEGNGYTYDSNTGSLTVYTANITSKIIITATAKSISEGTPYIDEDGNLQTCPTATRIHEWSTSWSEGWYVVDQDVTITGNIYVSGNVHLILADGCTLTVTNDICAENESSLTVYAQSGSTGVAALDGCYCASYDGSYDIAICGGTVTADCIENGNGTVIISGGTVNADYIEYCGTVAISGGTVNTDYIYECDTVAISGGIVTTEYIGYCDTVTISGGTVTVADEIDGTFSTGSGGSAFIVAGMIEDNDDKTGWSGVIFEGSRGAVYGTPTLTTDAEIPAGCTLTIDSGKCLTIAGDVTLKNGGAIVVDGNLLNNGTILGGTIDAATGSVTNNGTMPLYLLSQPTAAAPQINLSDPDANVSVQWQKQMKIYTVASSGIYDWQNMGNDVYQSTNKGISSTISTLTLSYTVEEDGNLEIGYKVSSESNYDKLSVIVTNSGGTEVGSAKDISGEVGWTTLSLTGLEPGTYTVTATYKKDSSESSGDDCAWLRIPDVWEDIPDAEGLTLPVTAAQAAGENLVRGVVTHSGGTVTSRPFQPAEIVTLTYDYQGADNGNTQTEKLCYINTPAGELPAPGKTGYLFLGWFTAASGDNKVTGETVVTSDMTIYAQWTEATYTLNVTAPTFDTVTYGYSQPDAKAITIENNGNSDATITRVALSGAGASAFTLNKTDGTTISTGATDSTTYTVQPNAGLDAGTYTATITVTYNGGATATATLGWEIDKATPNTELFDFAAPQNLVYDGNAKAATVAAKSGVTGMGNVTVKYYDAQGDEASPVDVGTYTVKIDVAEGGNYTSQTDITDTDWTFAITKSGSAVSGSDVTATYGEKITLSVNVTLPSVSTFSLYPAENQVSFYCGETLLGTVDVVNGTATLEYDTTKGGIPTGGQQTIAVYYGGSNDLGQAVGSLIATVSPAQVTNPVADDTVFTYTGEEQTYTVAENALYDVSGNKRTNAGSQTVTVALKDKINYTWTDGSTDDVTFTFTIDKADAIITVDTDPIVKTYGESWTLPVATSNFGTPVANLTVAQMSNAGSYTLTYTVAGTDNYNGDSKSISVTIDPAKVTKPDANSTTYIYTGEEQSYTVTENTLYEVSGNKRTDAGSQTVTVALKDKANYTWADGSTDDVTFTFTIEQKDISDATITLGIALTYTGEEQTMEVVSVTVDGLAVTYTVVGNTATNVGANDYTLTVTGTGNFKGTATKEWNISKATYDMSGVSFAGASYTFDGEEKVLLITGTLPTGVDVTYANNKLTNVGSVTATASFTGDSTNYELIPDKTATLTITNATFAVQATGYDGIYDGQPHSIAVTADGATITYSTDGTNYSAENPEYTNAGTYTVYYKAVKANHNDVTGSVTVNIAKATPVLTITPDQTTLSGGGKVELTVTGVPAEGTYEITCDPTISANADGSYTLPNETEVYTFTVSYSESSNYTAATATCTVSVTKYTYIPPMPNYYTLTFDTNGGTAISSITRVSGTTIDLTDYTTTREGFIFTGWYADEWLTEEVTSVKLRKDTTVYAGWEKIKEPIANPFKDVFESDWYYDDVMYVYEKDLMQGTATDMFSPAVTTTRGMIVTILYRLEGEPSTAGLDNPFTDLTQNWYIDAVKWAAENDIVAGYGNGKYGPEDPLTREQMVTILWRYAKYKGVDVSSGEDTNILSYNDVFDVSEYAIPAMQWAVTEGVIQGDQGFLTPKASAPRCQIAAILHRYCLLIEEE